MNSLVLLFKLLISTSSTSHSEKHSHMQHSSSCFKSSITPVVGHSRLIVFKRKRKLCQAATVLQTVMRALRTVHITGPGGGPRDVQGCTSRGPPSLWGTAIATSRNFAAAAARIPSHHDHHAYDMPLAVMPIFHNYYSTSTTTIKDCVQVSTSNCNSINTGIPNLNS